MKQRHLGKMSILASSDFGEEALDRHPHTYKKETSRARYSCPPCPLPPPTHLPSGVG